MRFITINLALGIYSSTNALVIRPSPSPSAAPLNLTSSKLAHLKGTQLLADISGTQLWNTVPDSQSWQGVTCDQGGLTDAAKASPEKWTFAHVSDAWANVTKSWTDQNGDVNGMADNLQFVAYVANYFNSSEGWNCQSPEDDSCNDHIQCKEASAPAAYLLLNSFAYFHQMLENFYTSISSASDQLSPRAFASAFGGDAGASKQMITDIIDTFSLVFTFGIAGTFNSMATQIVKKVGAGKKGFFQDTAYGVVGNIGAWMKDRELPPDEAQAHRDLTEGFLTSAVSTWSNNTAQYTKDIFSGKGDYLHQLYESMKKILAAYMIQQTWSIASDESGAHPFVWMTNYDCPPDGPAYLSLLHDLIPEEEQTKAMACHDGKTVLLLNAWRKGNYQGRTITGSGANALPGIEQLDEPSDDFGRVTKDDIVKSTLGAYAQNNGNDLSRPFSIDSLLQDMQSDNFDPTKYQDIVSQPGFWQIPVCDANVDVRHVLNEYDPASSKYWPCNWNAEIESWGYNMMGTNLHVNEGCILVNGESICAGKDSVINIPDPQNGGWSTAEVYAGFSGDTNTRQDYATCSRSMTWESSYGDVYYGADNYLYDSQGNKIEDTTGYQQQCIPLEGRGKKVDNPYYYKYHISHGS